MENRRPPRASSSGQKKRFPERDAENGRPGQFRRSGPGGQQTRALTGGRGRDGFNGRKAASNGRRGPKRGGQIKPVEENLIPIISDLQVTDGKYRGKFLQNSVSIKAQPTARKLREVMFKIVSRRVRAGRFLDLGSGPGTIGIEAISRGAMAGTFVERSAKMCTYIRKNIDGLGIKSGHGEVVEMEIEPFLKRAHGRRRWWDLVYFGARDTGEESSALSFLKRGTPIIPGGLLMIEHPSVQKFPDEFGSLKKWRTIGKDGSTITFYQKK